MIGLTNLEPEISVEGGLTTEKTEIRQRLFRNRKKSIIGIVSLVLSVLIVVSSMFVAPMLFKSIDDEVGFVGGYKCFMENFTDVKILDEVTAIQAVASVADVLGITNPEEQLKVIDVNKIGTDTYYRIQQYYEGIPFYGKTISVAAHEDGTSACLTSNYTPVDESFDVKADKNIKDVQEIVKEYLADANIEFENTAEELVIFQNSSNENERSENSEPVLAYRLKVKNYGTVIVNADTAEILYFVSNINAYSAEVQSKDKKYKTTGWKNDDGSYHLYNEEHNIEIFDLKGICSVIDIDTYATYDDFRMYGIDTMYSKNNEFDNEAIILLDNIVYLVEYFNAFGCGEFDCIQGAINDSFDKGNNAIGGCVELNGKECMKIILGKNRVISEDHDTIGHEFTHGVFRRFNPEYTSEEMDAINEGIADIFGELTECHFTTDKSIDWVHGSRNIEDPYSVGMASSLQQLAQANRTWGKTNFGKETWFYSLYDGGYESDFCHFASSVVSHSAYLMWNGIDGTTDRRIGEQKLAELWYRTMPLLNGDTTFSQMRNAMEISAKMMNLTDEEYLTVCDAFDMTGIERATISYYDVVKNEFELSVFGIDNGQNVKYRLEIDKVTADAPNYTTLHYQSVLRKTVNKGDYSLELENGWYVLRLTDLNEENSTMSILIIVGDSYKSAKEKIVLQTAFNEVLVVVIDSEDDTDQSDEYVTNVAVNGIIELFLTNKGSLIYKGQVGPGVINVPQRVSKLPEFDGKIVDFVCGSNHNAAITLDNELYMWGYNEYNQLGYEYDGNGAAFTTYPEKVMDDVVKVSLGEWTSAAVTKDGTLYLWGKHHMLGYKPSLPVVLAKDIKDVDITSSDVVAIDKNDDLYFWNYPQSDTPEYLLSNVKYAEIDYGVVIALTYDDELYIYDPDEKYIKDGSATNSPKKLPFLISG